MSTDKETTIPTLEEFIKEWWDRHPGLEATEMGSNGQYDELPYWEYDKLYGDSQPAE